MGPLLRRHGRVPSQPEVIAELMASDGRATSATSPRLNPVLRTADMVISVIRWRRRVDVVVIHVFTGRAFLTADAVSRVVRALGIPLVLMLHSGGLPDFRARHPRWVERVLRRAAHLVAPSNFLADRFGDLGVGMTVIPNVIRLVDYEYRERWQLRPRLLWMRSFDDLYRPGLAVAALAELRRTVPDATLTMAGQPGPVLERTRTLASELGVTDAVQFVGFLGEAAKREALREHDLFLVTTAVDNTPVSIVEAAAAGLPVVACKVGGIGDLLEHERTGLLVSDPSELASSVRRLLDDPRLAGRLSRNGRKLSEQFDWPAVRARWETLYDEVLGVVPC